MSLTNLPITLIPATFPNGYCPASYQALANDIATGLLAYVDGAYTLWNYGNSEPAPEDRLKPWYRTFPDGTPDKIYTYSGGSWISPHVVPPSGSEVRMWKGLEADLATYDGGNLGTVTDRTGPMWQVDHDYDARFPLGAGTLPSTTVVAVGDTGGEEKHTLLLAEMPSHNHLWTPSTATANANNADPNGGMLSLKSDAPPNQKLYTTSSAGGSTVNNVTTTTPHNNLPPYKAVFMIRRTARVFHTPIL